MGRKHTLRKIVLEESALAATQAGTETVCDQLDLVSYYLEQSNSAGFTGALTIQWKDDDTDWDDLPISTIALVADDEVIVEVEPNFKYIRPVITVAAGTADCQILVVGKTVGA